jgi:O-antigen/teichoic acid export membrane protein
VSDRAVTADASRELATQVQLRTLARGSALNLVGFVAAGVLAFVLAIIVTRSLGAHGAGVFFAAIAVFTILANVTELGADTGVVRFVSQARERGRAGAIRELVLVSIVPAAAAATLAAIAVAVWARPLADLFSAKDPVEVEGILRLLALFLPLSAVTTVALAATRGFGTMRPFVAIEGIGKPAAKPFLVLLLAAGGLGTAEAALGWGLPEAVGCAASLVVLVRLVSSAGAEQTGGIGPVFKEFWAFSAPRGVAAAFQITIVWLDLLILGHYRSLEEVGVYAAASRAVTVGTFALQAMRLAIAPQIAGLLARDDRDGAQRVYQTATWWLMAASWPLFIMFAIFGPTLLGVFGAGFSGGQRALLILSLAMLVNLGTGNVTVVLLMGGKSSWNLLNTAIALALNIGLNVALIPRFGMDGAAVAWAVSIVADNVLALIQVRRFLGLRPFGEGYVPAALVPIACVGGIGLLVRALVGSTPLALVVFLLTATPVYVAALWRYRTRIRLDQLVASFRSDGPGRPGGPPGVTAGTSVSRGPVRRAVRSGARAWGMLTADLRPPPEFMVIGTKRGGTTSLGAYLYAHPRVTPLVPPRLAPKGSRYFDEFYGRGDRWYRSHFATVLTRGPVRAPRKLAGESVANYLFHPLAAERAARSAPDARIIALVRDPVDRAWSHWAERRRRGVEQLSFEDALDAEEERLSGEFDRINADPRYVSVAAENFAYRAQGCYADLLQRWFERFDRDRVLVLVAEELFADPAEIYGRVLEFLELPSFDLGSYRPFSRSDVGGLMDPSTRSALEAFYAPHDRQLEVLLGRNLPWSSLHVAGR